MAVTNNSVSFSPLSLIFYDRRQLSGDDLHCRVLEHGDKPLDDLAATPRALLRLQEQVREKVKVHKYTRCG